MNILQGVQNIRKENDIDITIEVYIVIKKSEAEEQKITDCHWLWWNVDFISGHLSKIIATKFPRTPIQHTKGSKISCIRYLETVSTRGSSHEQLSVLFMTTVLLATNFSV